MKHSYNHKCCVLPTGCDIFKWPCHHHLCRISNLVFFPVFPFPVWLLIPLLVPKPLFCHLPRLPKRMQHFPFLWSPRNCTTHLRIVIHVLKVDVPSSRGETARQECAASEYRVVNIKLKTTIKHKFPKYGYRKIPTCMSCTPGVNMSPKLVQHKRDIIVSELWYEYKYNTMVLWHYDTSTILNDKWWNCNFLVNGCEMGIK